MPRYVDGYVLPIPRKKVKEYRRLAAKAARIWRDHGALEYRECIGEDLKPKWGVPFTKRVQVRPGETVVFSWVVFRSRAHRDRVNAKVMSDPRLADAGETMPFDMKRMVYGGFEELVSA